ncbi:MAG TPA: amidohydrolase [Gemmatimonadales bacterium]|nr:amidohydrolase [Gemmatimonadales bacterium]
MSFAPATGFLRTRRLLTLSPDSTGDGLYWRNGRIEAVGDAKSIRRHLAADTPEYDLEDLLITPGFVDSHTHFGQWALSRRQVHLAGCDRAEALRRVAAAPVEQGWIRGHGWDANNWDKPPHRGMLDAIASGPVWLDSLDVHAAWLNAAALSALGITRETADPAGGRVVRDAAGEPTGVLMERAVEMAAAGLPAPHPAGLLVAVKEAQREANRLGVTGIHDMGDRHSLAAFQQLDAAAELTLRVLFCPPVTMLPELAAAGARTGSGGPMLRTGGIKMFLDGSLGSQTAWMLEPYAGSTNRGMTLTSHDEARAAMHLAGDHGFAVAVHAIGDAAVRRALELIEELPHQALPHRIEHLQCVHPDDLDRAGRAGIVASMQPAHLLADIPLAERHWGERSRGAYVFRSLIRRGTVVAFGSDMPVATPDPRAGIFAALDRTALDGKPAGGWYPGEALDFAAALSGYTAGPAAAAGLAATSGRLAPGCDADFVAWDVDPLAERGSGEAFLAGRARLTVVGGRIAWSDLN